MEIDWQILGVSAALASIFVIMIWKVPTWETYPFLWKIIISVGIYPCAYWVTWKQMEG